MTMTRRTVLAQGTALLGAGWMAPGLAAGRIELDLGPPHAFDFDQLVALARQTAAEPYRAPLIAAPEQLDLIDYDAHWRIRFQDEASATPVGAHAPVQFFHPGKFFREAVKMHFVENGEAREVLYRQDYFDMPADSPARNLPTDVGFAGFRVMREGLAPDWVSFLGASYFRTDGPFGQYGLSARGLALNTGLSVPEEFPRFSHFWIGAPEDPADTLTCWALLDSPSVAGAYRIGLRRGGEAGSITTISARLFTRRAVERMGIAPLTSMYWYSERDRILADEWRPEVHDSDGLSMSTGTGERIWRPLNNPLSVRTSSFFDRDPRGFGLVQRDRDFSHYQDDGVFYDRRATAWVEPIGEWGPGAVQLVEIPTHDETFDNIVAYWLPESLPQPGEERRFDYRIHWTDQDPPTAGIAKVVATRQGQGGIPGQDIPQGVDKMVVDFEGDALRGLTVESGVEPVIDISGGTLLEPVAVRPIVGTDQWRLSFDFTQDRPDPVDLRAYLRRGDQALSETWIAQAVTDRECCRGAG
ncbi:MAG: glucan biosynthesis protein D [Pseudomonadota bacterium]